MNALSSRLTELRKNPMPLLVVLAIAIIPMLYAGALTWANHDPTGNLHKVSAAVVNQDEPADVDGQDDPYQLGDDLTDELVSNTDDQNFDWEEMSADEAQSQLEDGEVMAVLTIPDDLSSSAASLSTGDPEDAVSTSITMTTNDATNQIIGQVSHSVATNISEELTENIQTEYLEGLYSQLNDSQQGLGDAADSADELANGAENLSSQMPELSSGASDVADGLDQLQSGYGAMSEEQIQGMLAELNEGAQQVDSGTDQAQSGAQDLAEGNRELADELDNSSSGDASYSEENSQHLASIVAEPVSMDQERINEVPSYGYGLAPYFVSLSLWVGALSFYLMMPALNTPRLRGDSPTWWVTLRSYAPGLLMGVAQSALAVLILRFGVGLEVSNFWGLAGIMALSSLAFFAVNQALVALFGAPGRFLALILLVLQLASAGGTYPIETAPGPIEALHAWLPMTYTVEAIRSLIAGGTLGVEPAVWVLGGTTLIGLLLTFLAVLLNRRSAHRDVAEDASSPS
jgi:putative membrane protein